ncbi:hypothetical protein B0T10DRAFT_187808 [Thelonectria olida]|uniref:Uncharacterized protein n=1 Tax=Thelonectria olida TaxID=1576542 RepID=A0A9P9AVU0_9HYPO|nr:hypothetical protein B0T10DRAFT_187808 [Thelonectria olida]
MRAGILTVGRVDQWPLENSGANYMLSGCLPSCRNLHDTGEEEISAPSFWWLWWNGTNSRLLCLFPCQDVCPWQCQLHLVHFFSIHRTVFLRIQTGKRHVGAHSPTFNRLWKPAESRESRVSDIQGDAVCNVVAGIRDGRRWRFKHTAQSVAPY